MWIESRWAAALLGAACLGAAGCGAAAATPATPASDGQADSSAHPVQPTSSPVPANAAKRSVDDTPATAGARATDVSRAVATLLEEIEAEKRWRDQLSAPNEEFLTAVRGKLRAWGRALALLNARGHDEQADRVAAAIVELRNHWGPELLPTEQLSSFPRDMFDVGPLEVLVVQFFEPVPYYPGNRRILKLYQFLVYDQGRAVADYCLEYSQLAGDYYVLGRMDPQAHTQIQPYGDRPPPYAALRQRVIQDLRGLGRRSGPSLHKGR